MSAAVDGRQGRRLLVVRHGETDSNAAGIWQGQLDHPLSERGRRQALEAATALAALRPVRVVSSDLSRAWDTGTAVAQAAGVEIHGDPRLREIHAGAWQGLTTDQVRSGWREDFDRLLTAEDFARGETGETLAQVAARTLAATEEIIDAMEPGETVVIATHGVAARSLVSAVVGLDQSQTWLTLGGLANCHWAAVEEGRAGWRILQWNVGAAPAVGGSITAPA